jgi:hypothetical protein
MSIETAIRDAIFEVILPAYADPSVEFVCRVWPGQSIDARQYGNPWSPTNPNGVVVATENLSAFVDAIPNLSNAYSRSGRTVEDSYKQVVTFGHAKSSSFVALSELGAASTEEGMVNLPTEPDSTPALPAVIAIEIDDRTETNVTMPDGKVIQTIVMSPEAQSGVELARKHADQAALLKALNAVKERYPAAERPALESQVAQVEKSSARSLSALQKFGARKTALLEGAPSLSRGDVDTPSITSAFYKARTMFEKSYSSSVKDPLLQYHPSYLSPEDWTDKQSADDWNFLTIPIQVEGSRVNLSLKFSRVDITRPWFLMSVFDLPDWATRQEAGSLSNGKAQNNPGSFPLLPLSMIVAREIRAIAAADQTTLFQANGLQVLAWINKIMPFSPH